MIDKAICIRKNTYRYGLEYGTTILFSPEYGLEVMQFDIRDGEDIIKSIDEILKYENNK